RNVLDGLVIDLLEAEGFVPVVVIVTGDGVVAAASRITGRGAPVEANRGLGVHIGRIGAQTRERCRRKHRLDGRKPAETMFLRPSCPLDPSPKQQVSPCRPEGQ